MNRPRKPRVLALRVAALVLTLLQVHDQLAGPLSQVVFPLMYQLLSLLADVV